MNRLPVRALRSLPSEGVVVQVDGGSPRFLRSPLVELSAQGAAPGAHCPSRAKAMPQRQGGAARLDAMFVTLALLSALGVVAAQHQSRKLHTALERETARMQQLEVEWGQLQLEQSTWAAHVRIEKIASQRLHMQPPTFDQILVIGEGP